MVKFILNKELEESVIRRSIPLMVVRIVLIEIIFEFFYIFWRFLIDVNLLQFSNEILLFIHSISLAIFFILVAVVQTGIIVFIILDWVNRYYEIRPDEVVFRRGIVTKKEMAYPYRDIQSVRLEQSLLGRILNYGIVEVYIPTLGYNLYFTEVSNPQNLLQTIKDKTSSVKGERFLFKRS